MAKRCADSTTCRSSGSSMPLDEDRGNDGTVRTHYEFRPVGDGDKTARTELFYREEIQLALRNRGMPLEGLRYAITPTGMHYLLIHFDIPAAEEATWRLKISGRVTNPRTLGINDIKSLPEVTMPVTLECAGNGRALMLELSRFGGQVTSAFRDTVADRTVLPTECRVKGTIPHAGRLRAAETAAIAGSCTRVAGGGRAARSRRSAKDDRIRGSLRVPRSGGKDRSGPQ